MKFSDEFLVASDDGCVFPCVIEVQLTITVSEVLIHHSLDDSMTKLFKDPLRV